LAVVDVVDTAWGAAADFAAVVVAVDPDFTVVAVPDPEAAAAAVLVVTPSPVPATEDVVSLAAVADEVEDVVAPPAALEPLLPHAAASSPTAASTAGRLSRLHVRTSARDIDPPSHRARLPRPCRQESLSS
jgi:hypothetical protein